MRARSRWRHPERGVAIVGLLAVLTVGCTVGPAANRAARESAAAEHADGGDRSDENDDRDNGDPTEWPTDEPTASPTPEPPPPASAAGSLESSQISDSRANPCCVAELPGGDLLVGTPDSGTLYRVSDEEAAPVGELRALTVSEDRALVDLTVDPDPTGTIFVYASYLRGSEIRVGSYTYNEDDPAGDQLTPANESLVEDLPAESAGALAFGSDGMLYVGAGDEVLRVDSNGHVPDDNPEPGSAVYASGFGDVRGLAVDPVGRLWVVGTQDGATVLSVVSRDGEDGTLSPPVETWRTEAAPTGLAYGADSRSLWLTTETDDGAWRIPLDGEGGLVDDPELLPDDGLTGIVDLVPAADADDRLWALDGSGAVLELVVS